MRCAVVLLIAATATASAETTLVFGYEQPIGLRPDLAESSVTRYEVRGGTLVEVSRDHRVFDANGRLLHTDWITHDVAETRIADFVWDADGHPISASHRTMSGHEATVTYKLDDHGRIASTATRFSPEVTIKARYRWNTDGTCDVAVSNSHYRVDASERVLFQCQREHCARYTYDAHRNLARVEESWASDEWFPKRTIAWTYRPDGKADTRTDGNIRGTYAYNARGDVDEIVERTNGTLSAKTTYSYVYR